MERKFRITVDGRLYNVTVEDLSDVGNLPSAAPMYVPAAVAAVAPAAAAPAPAPVARGAADAGDVVCTLGGTVESVNVTVGQQINAGDKVVVVEAMKMKTPQVAHRAGKVSAILVKVGEAVETGQPLIKIA